MSKVAVIIPAYNSQQYIGDTVRSVINQTYSDWQIVVSDDNSSDQTIDVVNKFKKTDSRIEVYTHTNLGYAANCNYGLSKVSQDTDFIMFLDNDDFLEPYALELLVERLDTNPDAVAAYGLPRFVNHLGEPDSQKPERYFGYPRYFIRNDKLLEVRDEEPNTDFSAMVIWSQIATGGQILIRKQAIVELGGMDLNVGIGSDWDLWIQLALMGSFIFTKTIVMNKRYHDNNASSQGRILAISEPAIRKKLQASDKLTAKQKKIARLGHLYSCYFKLIWSREAFLKGGIFPGIRQLIRAMKAYLIYLRDWTLMRYAD